VVRVPRTVFDPEEDEKAILLSEIGRSERYWTRRSRASDAIKKWSSLRALRQRIDIEVIDLHDEEFALFAELQTRPYARKLGFANVLDPGEAAVIAAAVARGWHGSSTKSFSHRANYSPQVSDTYWKARKRSWSTWTFSRAGTAALRHCGADRRPGDT